MREWHEFYARKLTMREYIGNLNVHIPLLEEVVKEKPSKILEVGAGTGSMATFLSYLGYEVVCVDNDEKVLKNSAEFCEKWHGNVTFFLCDAFQLSKKFKEKEFNVVFSQGLYEHFTDENIKKLLREQLKVGKVVIFSVPSKYYPQKDFGDEWLLTVKSWRKILRAVNVEFIKYYYTSEISLKLLIRQLLRYPYPPLIKPYNILVKVREVPGDIQR